MTKHRQGRFVFSTVLSAILSYKLGHRIRCSSLNINRLDMFRSQPAIHPASLKESKENQEIQEIHRKFKEIHRKFKEIQRNSKEIQCFYKKSLIFLWISLNFIEFPMNFIEFHVNYLNFLNSEGCNTQIIQPAIHPASLRESKEIMKFNIYIYMCMYVYVCVFMCIYIYVYWKYVDICIYLGIYVYICL